MKLSLDETHDPSAQSWVESANATSTDFPIQNLPFGVFRKRGGGSAAKVGVAIGDQVLDIVSLGRASLLGTDADAARAARACDGGSLSALMELGTGPRRALRRRIFVLLRNDAPASDREAVTRHLIRQADVEMLLPAAIGDYTDFYASIFHATNVGKLFRPDNPLLPNYKYIPIGYHGRASSLVPSSASVQRPCGQTRVGESAPAFGPSKALDYELEVGIFVGSGNQLGERIPIAEAGEHIFGVCLINDWSARDVQAWEYQPLGPFLAKSFATSLSPWVVTTEALAPFRAPAFARAAGDPTPLPYLLDADDQVHGGVDMTLEVSLQSERMREQGIAPALVSRSNFRDLYWTMAQMLAHHTSNGCNLRAGDLLASGTVSGPDVPGAEVSARGCLLELTSRGVNPITLPSGELRKFLEDGDEVILRGFCEREGLRRIGLGSCRGRIAPASM
ncbi:MAG TPA: fumarylacetoacetase [Terriglobales bacterium]|nr:fumarylacetoacetase [Terriglobales bacterium]